MAHEAGRDAVKVNAVLPHDVAGAAELYVGFVNQCGGLKRMGGALIAEARTGDSVQFQVNAGHEFVLRRTIAIAQPVQE